MTTKEQRAEWARLAIKAATTTYPDTMLERLTAAAILGHDAVPALLADLAAAESERDAAREALRAMVEWFWGATTESPLESYERVGEEFYAETGMLRPGKSYPLESHEPDPKERRKRWDEWVKAKRDALEAKARAALAGKGGNDGR